MVVGQNVAAVTGEGQVTAVEWEDVLAVDDDSTDYGEIRFDKQRLTKQGKQPKLPRRERTL